MSIGMIEVECTTLAELINENSRLMKQVTELQEDNTKKLLEMRAVAAYVAKLAKKPVVWDTIYAAIDYLEGSTTPEIAQREANALGQAKAIAKKLTHVLGAKVEPERIEDGINAIVEQRQAVDKLCDVGTKLYVLWESLDEQPSLDDSAKCGAMFRDLEEAVAAVKTAYDMRVFDAEEEGKIGNE